MHKRITFALILTYFISATSLGSAAFEPMDPDKEITSLKLVIPCDNNDYKILGKELIVEYEISGHYIKWDDRDEHPDTYPVTFNIYTESGNSIYNPKPHYLKGDGDMIHETDTFRVKLDPKNFADGANYKMVIQAYRGIDENGELYYPDKDIRCGFQVTSNPRGQPQKITPPELIFPLGLPMPNGCYAKTCEHTWKFLWDSVPGATLYNLYVKHPDAENPVINVNIEKTFYWHTALGYVSDENRFGWEWKVRAKVNGKWSSYSTDYFDVLPIKPNPQSKSTIEEIQKQDLNDESEHYDEESKPPESDGTNKAKGALGKAENDIKRIGEAMDNF